MYLVRNSHTRTIVKNETGIAGVKLGGDTDRIGNFVGIGKIYDKYVEDNEDLGDLGLQFPGI